MENINNIRKIRILCEKECIGMSFFGLENNEYAFCWGLDFLRKYNSLELNKSRSNGLGLGCGSRKFSLNNINYKFEYDEMIGLWIETKDANENSPEEVKQKVKAFGQELFDELVRKEAERKSRGF